jgi:hypothetical protein
MDNTINSNRSILVFMRCYQTSLVTIGVYPVGSCLIAPARPTVATSPADIGMSNVSKDVESLVNIDH